MNKPAIPNCAVIESLKILSGKWKPCILCYLQQQTLRYSELERLIPNVSRKMLSAQLRELEQDGLLTRRHYAVIPPKVEYSLTIKGKSLLPVLEMLQNWSLEHYPTTKSMAEMLAWAKETNAAIAKTEKLSQTKYKLFCYCF